MSSQHSFEFTSVEVFKDRQIGVGAYGTVYLAMCDELPCAAKIIHSFLFDSTNLGSKRIMERFQQECDFISKIRHPNIVQCLGVHRDKKLSNGPILLMELLDENLTAFLEKQDNLLAFHVQVNICHDVALAVAYLHSNKVIHRDLSSNNVLLVGNAARSKLVDFGMAKLEEKSLFRRNRVTQAPGTSVYMAPELLKDKPECNEKVDSFSIGVLIVQILTLLFPDPESRTETRMDPSSRTMMAEYPVTDVERRKNHIDLIHTSNPLLLMAKECLSFSHKDRPTSQVLCQQLAAQKESEQYQKSHKDGRINSHFDRCDAKSRNENNAATGEGTLPSRIPEMLTEMEGVIRQQEAKIAELESQIRALCRLNSLPPSADVPKRERGVTPVPLALGSVAVDGTLAYFRPSKSGEVHVFNYTTKEWSCTPACKRSAFSLAIIDGLLTAVGGYDEHNNDTATLLSLVGDGDRKLWVEHFPSMPTRRSFCTIAVSQKYAIVAGGLVGTRNILNNVELMDIESKSWFKSSNLLTPLFEATATILGGNIYVIGGCDQSKHWTSSVYTCSLASLKRVAHPANEIPLAIPPVVWVKLSDLTVSRSICTVAHDNLLCVCGKRDGVHSDTVLRYNVVSNSWEEYQRSSHARSRCLVAVFPGDRLMIVGGWGNSGQILQSYEMVDIV